MQMLDTKKRVAIIRSARSQFYKRGIKATTMQHVADGANVSVGTIYLYFKNKSDLILGCTEDFAVIHDEFVATLKHKQIGWDQKLKEYVLSRFRLQNEMGSSPHGKAIAQAVIELAPERVMAQANGFVTNVNAFIDEGIAARKITRQDLDALKEVMTYAIGYFFPVAGKEPLHPPTEEALARVLDWYVFALTSESTV